MEQKNVRVRGNEVRMVLEKGGLHSIGLGCRPKRRFNVSFPCNKNKTKICGWCLRIIAHKSILMCLYYLSMDQYLKKTKSLSHRLINKEQPIGSSLTDHGLPKIELEGHSSMTVWGCKMIRLGELESNLGEVDHELLFNLTEQYRLFEDNV